MLWKCVELCAGCKKSSTRKTSPMTRLSTLTAQQWMHPTTCQQVTLPGGGSNLTGLPASPSGLFQWPFQEATIGNRHAPGLVRSIEGEPPWSTLSPANVTEKFASYRHIVHSTQSSAAGTSECSAPSTRSRSRTSASFRPGSTPPSRRSQARPSRLPS